MPGEGYGNRYPYWVVDPVDDPQTFRELSDRRNGANPFGDWLGQTRSLVLDLFHCVLVDV